jgi:hypothetical protein
MFGEVFWVREKEALTQGVFAAVDEIIDRQESQITHGMVVDIGIDQSYGKAPPPRIGAEACFRFQASVRLIDQFSGHKSAEPKGFATPGM